MINPVDWMRQRRARRRFMPDRKPQRTGRTARVAGVLLVVILLAALVLDYTRADGSDSALIEYAEQNRLEPLDLIETAARSRPLLFLGDVPGAAAPKRLAAQAVERVGLGSGLDAVVVDVDAAEQPFIDRYLATAPEDASILLGRPRAIREAEGTGRAMLDLYRAVYRVNQELGAARRIRIIAADAEGWPPARSVSQGQAAQLFGRRAEAMAEAVQQRAFARNPNARLLFFVDGLFALRQGGARILTGGTSPVDVTWLAARFAGRRPQDVFTILVDAQPARVAAPAVASYAGTDFAEPLRRGGLGGEFALRSGPALDATRTPIRVRVNTGIEFNLEPRAARFSELANALILLGN